MWFTAPATWRRKRLYNAAARAGAVVLRYHSVAEPDHASEYIDPVLSLPPRVFREQIRALKRSCEITSVSQLVDRSARVSQRLRVAITLDDGYRDNLDAAAILSDEHATAGFFIATDILKKGKTLWTSELWRLVNRLPQGSVAIAQVRVIINGEQQSRRLAYQELVRACRGLSIESRDAIHDELAAMSHSSRLEGLEEAFLRPKDLIEMKNAGMTIGAHTRSHPHLDYIAGEDCEEETSGSRLDLQEILDGSVDFFAYPNPGGGGGVATVARDAVQKAGFKAAFTSNPDALSPATDPFRFPRLGVYSGEQAELLFSILSPTRVVAR